MSYVTSTGASQTEAGQPYYGRGVPRQWWWKPGLRTVERPNAGEHADHAEEDREVAESEVSKGPVNEDLAPFLVDMRGAAQLPRAGELPKVVVLRIRGV